MHQTIPPKQGDTRTFEIYEAMGTTTITAEALLVDETAAYWLDISTQPQSTLDPQMLQELAEGFSTIIVPRQRIYFGKESDIDGDGLISVLFSPLVGQRGATAYFSPCDLLDPAVVPYCGDSNQMELIYVSTPDMLEPYMATSQAMLETAAHELQHAIYFYRKYVINNIYEEAENPYITEGLSALAQDLSGYQAGNFFVTMAGLEGIDVISLPNLLDDAISVYVPGMEDGYMRGAGYLLIRYLFDYAGGEQLDAAGTPVDTGGIAWLNSYVDSQQTGLDNALNTSGLTLEKLVDHFWTALAVSNRGDGGTPINDDPKYNYLPTTNDPFTGRQRGCNLFASFHSMQLSGPKTQMFNTADGRLRPGGAEFLMLQPEQGASTVGFRVTIDPAAKAQARLIRID
jgi:hypothetical protein